MTYTDTEPDLPKSDYLYCYCSDSSGECDCRGIVRNPLGDPTQAPSLFLCMTLSACPSVPQVCNLTHLYGLPNLSEPV